MEILQPLFPQALILGTALLVLCLRILVPEWSRVMHWIGVLGTVLALVSLARVPLGVPVPGFFVDSLGLFSTGLLLLCTLFVLIYSASFLERYDLASTEWTFLLLSATLGLSMMVNTQNLIVVFIGLELSSLAFYVLCGYRREQPRSLESSLKYFVLGSVGSAVLLLGLALVYLIQGTLVITEFMPVTGPAGPGMVASTLIVLLGFLFKLSVVPLHVWVPDVYEGAPTPITAYMSIAVKAAALGVLARFAWALSAVNLFDWSGVLWWFAVLTILGGNILALVQESVKRMLAYSSISHAGYLTLGLVASSHLGTTALLFYLTVYLFMNVTAFGVVSLVGEEDDPRYPDLQGLSSNHPFVAAGLALCMVSLAGLPPTGGFMGKLMLFYGVVQAGYSGLAVIAVLGSLISVAYYFRVIVHAYMKEPGGDRSPVKLPGAPLSRLTVVVTSLVLLYLGLAPAWVYDTIAGVVSSSLG